VRWLLKQAFWLFSAATDEVTVQHYQATYLHRESRDGVSRDQLGKSLAGKPRNDVQKNNRNGTPFPQDFFIFCQMRLLRYVCGDYDLGLPATKLARRLLASGPIGEQHQGYQWQTRGWLRQITQNCKHHRMQDLPATLWFLLRSRQ
jgi:hypothetical protein